ncbi:DUF805 domain-containing protein [Sphingomonas turrisvirgatae]|uniref:DUF805 domain-containing protein n=1 Tax=Sphingomonas turrisvirgatae TaxID=1888892 RepID=A0A1E3M094_9SPHN|nr:DUF805 domain-containing protein [Sphingomonas turrisvirgatae]ODP39409.1 hypothetical protein BFL28_10010 [Sphingomonas turrisvirgatae]
MNWMILPLKRYFDFKGRSRRKEYWMYTLFLVIVSIVLSLIDAALGLGGSATSDSVATDTTIGGSAALTGGLLANVFSIATFIPSLAVAVRRLHDLNRSGWFILLPLGPMLLGGILLAVGAVGALDGSGSGAGGAAMAGLVLMGIGAICALVLLVWMFMEGTRGPNRFGDDPKGVATNVEEVFG